MPKPRVAARRGDSSQWEFPCYFCGGRTSIRDGFLVFFDQETGEPLKGQMGVRFLSNGGRAEFAALAWPGNGEGLVSRGAWTDYQTLAVLSHANCGPDGYWFPFDRLIKEHVELRKHVSAKKWWFMGADRAFDWALAAAGEKGFA